MKSTSNKLVYTLAAIIIILLVTSGIELINHQEQRALNLAELEKVTLESQQAERQARQNETEADHLAKFADSLKQTAMMAQAEAQAAKLDAEAKRLVAKKAQEAARIAEAKAKSSEAIAAQEHLRAEQEAELKNIAVMRAARLRYIAQGKVMALKSLELGDDPEQEALIAVQAYKFNVTHGGYPHDSDIENALRHALDRSATKSGDSTRTWPSSTGGMSAALCGLLRRNLTRKEWDTFVGSDMPYERTCDALPANNK